jgi:hypothetical protein
METEIGREIQEMALSAGAYALQCRAVFQTLDCGIP